MDFYEPFILTEFWAAGDKWTRDQLQHEAEEDMKTYQPIGFRPTLWYPLHLQAQ